VTTVDSLTANPGKRLWAGGFDGLSVTVLFLVIAVGGEASGFDLARWSVLATVFFTYHFGCLAFRDGRTLGKTAMDICVVSASGQPLIVPQSLARAGVRTVPFAILAFPGGELPGAVLLALLVTTEVNLLERPPARQTLADRVARSLVVNAPPLQPHRAPAAPMFSAGDAEFGFPPQRPSDKDRDWRKRSNPAFERTAASALRLLAVPSSLRSSAAAQRER